MKISCKKGFTLIEMAIVVMILGIALAAGAKIYDLHRKTIAIEDTQVAIADLNGAIGDFRSVFGRYPCPASLTATRDDPTYGREQCEDLSDNSDFSDVAPGQCKNGICIEESVRDIPAGYLIGATLIPTTTATATTPRVRIGAIPFRDLNLDEINAYDGYGNRISYVVTEHLAFSDSFQNDGGGIEILGDSGATALAAGEEGSAHFLIFSHGANGEGAYTMEGIQIPCTTTSAEGQNCENNDQEAIYNYSMGNTAEGATQTDDVMAFFTQRDLPIWQKNEDNPNDVYLKPKGNLGFGFNRDTDIPEELTVQRTLRAEKDPVSNEGGRVDGNSLCTRNSTTPECFPTALIGGKLAEGGGMKCPDGQFMKGIANNQPICEVEVKLTCPAGKYMTGVDYYGNIICNVKPPKACAAENLPIICEDLTTTHNRLYPATGHGALSRQYSIGTRYGDYTCNNGTWVKNGFGGRCFCTPDTTSQPIIEQECSTELSYDCGKLWNGQRKYQQQYICPAGEWQWRELPGNCTCNPNALRYHQVGCPVTNVGGVEYSYTGGHQIHVSKAVCTGSPTCSPRTLHENHCTCTPRANNVWEGCPGNLTDAAGNPTTFLKKQNFLCPDGADKPGYWTPLVDSGDENGQAARCLCVPRRLSDIVNSCPLGHRPLPASQGGPPTTHREVICTAGVATTVVTNTGGCEPIPPPVCTRQPVTGSWSGRGENQNGIMGDGSERCVTCADQPVTVPCSTGSQGNFQYYRCSCQQ